MTNECYECAEPRLDDRQVCHSCWQLLSVKLAKAEAKTDRLEREAKRLRAKIAILGEKADATRS